MSKIEDGGPAKFTPGPWVDYAHTPPPAVGIYEWRVPSIRCEGLVVRLFAWHRDRGAGYQRVNSPSFDHWNGYRVTVPSGTQWRSAPPDLAIKSHETPISGVDGLEFSRCPFCGRRPTLEGVERSNGGGVYIGSGPHRYNSWWLDCCGWAKTPRYDDPRKLEAARAALLKARGGSNE